MKFFGKLKLSVKLPLMLVAISLVALTIMGVSAYRSAHDLLAQEGAARLQRTLETRAQEIADWSAQVDASMRSLALNEGTLRALREFRVAWNMKGDEAASTLRAAYPPVNPFVEDVFGAEERADFRDSYSVTHARLNHGFAVQAQQMGFEDLFLVDEAGRVVYSLSKGDAFASDLRATDAPDTPFKHTVLGVLDAEKPALLTSEFQASADQTGASYYVAAPIVEGEGTLRGVVVAKVPTHRIDQVLARARGFGETGQAYLVTEAGLIANQLRLASEGSVLNRSVEHEGVSSALAGASGVKELPGLDGAPAVLAYHPLQLDGRNYAVVAEQSAEELFAEANGLGNSMLFHGGWNLAVLIVVASVMARSVSSPLRRLGQSIARISAGDRQSVVEGQKRGDEVGDIARALDLLRQDLARADAAQIETAMQSTAFNASSAAMMMVDIDFNVLYCNSAVEHLISAHIADFRTVYQDLDADRIVGLNMDVFHRMPAHARRVLSDPANLPFRTDIVVGEGRFGLDVSAITDESGAMIGYVVEWRDVTDLRMQRALIDALDTTQCVCELKPDHEVLKINANFCTALGIAAEDFVGADLLSLMSMPGAKTDITAAIAEGTPVLGRFHIASPSGSTVVLDGSITPVPDRNNRIFKIVVIGSDVTAAETSLSAARQRNEVMIAAQRKVVEALRVGLSRLSDGDLSAKIDQAFSEEYEHLRADFNQAVEKLSSAMQVVIDNASTIDCEAQEISRAAEDLSRRTEQQAATLEETAAAIDELTSSVSSASDGVGEADRVVAEARQSAEASGEIVSQAVSAMSEIEDSSKQISKIIGVIDEIAFQTNLLALNAGVEAARAGEAGRGFAVVASEVRALAQRSSEAAREIDTLITASSNHVRRGVDLVGQTGQSLKGILQAVTDVASRVSEIAASSREQAAGLSEINSAMNQLDQVTQQNAAMFEETTAASHSLSRGAEALRQTTGQFQTAHTRAAQASSAPAPQTVAPPKAAPAPAKPAASQIQTWSKKPEAKSSVSAPAGKGNVALKVDEDDWEDF